jgi:Zn-dependent alcohol dehydrogenase
VRAAITDGTLTDGTTRIALDGETVYRMTTTGAFADAVLVTSAAAMPIPNDLPFEQAALLGCAALTGTGAPLNSYYGSADPVKSLGQLLELVADGSLLLEPLLGSRYPLDRIEEAVAEVRTATGGRVILTPSDG